MLILHVRQCEVALADARLDEAYDLALRCEIGRHRRGQRVLTRLLQAFVRRGQEHLKAARYAAALADGEKAARIGGNVADVVALRAAAADAIAQSQRLENRQARVLATARRHLDDGWLDLGEQALVDAPADASRVAALRETIARRRRAACDAAAACRQALKHGEIDAAAREFIKARGADANHAEMIGLAGEVEAALRAAIEQAFEDGQLDRAGALVERLRTIDREESQASRYQILLDRLREAWQQVAHGAYGEAAIAIARVQAMAKHAGWLKQAAEQLRRADQAISELKIGPLAWLGQPAGAVGTQVSPSMIAKPGGSAIPWHEPMKTSGDIVPSQFLLQVDGVGAFLVLRQAVVTIGPISSPVQADVALVAEPTLPHLSIARVEDDYFLKTAGAVGGRLLASGQRIELSPRCALTFKLPSAASTSAVLELSSARLPRSDIRRVILMDQDLIIGPGAASHVVARGVEQPLVLHVRRDQLIYTGRDAVSIAGRQVDAATPLPLDAPIQIGGVSFVLTRPGSLGSRGLTC